MRAKMKFILGLIVLALILVSFSSKSDNKIDLIQTSISSRIETFTFLSNGTATKGKIYLPVAYKANKNLPVIYLIDYTEQHFKVATDEFEKVIDGVGKIQGFDALVVSLEGIPEINAAPETFHQNYQVFKNMVSYVNDTYTNNNTNTFIGRGNESSIVLMTLFLENDEASVFDNFIATDPSPMFTSTVINLIEKDSLHKNKSDKKLHFSFSKTNNREECKRIINKINNAQFSWLQFESIEYSDSDYENTYPIAYADGLKYIFNL